MMILKQLTSCLGYLAVIYVTGLIFLPVSARLFRYLPDRGYCVNKIIGITGFGLLSWFLNAFGLLHFSTTGLWILLGAAAICSFTLQNISSHSEPLLSGHIRLRYIALTELVFIASFFLWLYVRACMPDITHTEQPMDFMMLSAICRSDSFPIQDLWLAGCPVSYYYFGYWLQAIPAQLTGIQPALAYNIAQASWFALLFSGCFGLGITVSSMSFRHKSISVLSGFFCAGSVILCSNAAGLLDAIKRTSEYWWWWKASRTVYDGTTELITEFPAFSFILGDSHPHLLNLPILLLAVFACLNILCKLRNESNHPRFFLLTASCFLGITQAVVFMTNSWDWPIVFGIGFLTLVIPVRGFKTRIRHAMIYCACSFAALIFIPLPYYLIAQNQVNGISFFHGLHTSASEWIHIFGLILPALLLSFSWILWQTLRKKEYSISVLFLAILFIAGLIAALLPEYVFIRDVFNNRMNTVFKFYYQSWFYLSLAASLGIITAAASRIWRIPALLAALLMLSGLIYPARALYDLTNGFSLSPLGLNGTAAQEQQNPDLSQAAEWIRQHTPGEAVFLTAPGKSYDPSTIWITMMTQRPVILGWAGHEQQWRGPAYPQMTSNRFAFINAAYRNGPVRTVIENPLWNQTDYFLVSPHERTYADNRRIFLAHSMSNYLAPVFSNQTIMIYEKK